MSYLLERLEKLDREIEKEEKALLHLNKQAGNKVSKIKTLKEEYTKVHQEYVNSPEVNDEV